MSPASTVGAWQGVQPPGSRVDDGKYLHPMGQTWDLVEIWAVLYIWVISEKLKNP
jgi:hypothetical protein